jgi:hypothetical protein
MRNLRSRLDDLEERKTFREYLDERTQFEGRSCDELRFFAVHGYFPEAAGGNLPERQEFTVGGMRTVITTEMAGNS